MFLRATIRKKDGKEHRYFSVVENKRSGTGCLNNNPRFISGLRAGYER